MLDAWRVRQRMVTLALIGTFAVLCATTMLVHRVVLANNLSMICLLAQLEARSIEGATEAACFQGNAGTLVAGTRMSIFAGLSQALAGNGSSALATWRQSPDASAEFLLRTGDNLIGYRAADVLFAMQHPPSTDALALSEERFQRARTLSRFVSSADYRLGLVGLLHNQPEDAAARFAGALAADDFLPADIPSAQFAAAYWLARIAWDSGNATDACAHLNEALTYSSNNEIALAPLRGWGCEPQ